MALSWNEIKDRASLFSNEWETASREDADAKSFWDDFFNVFGVNRRRVATFEYKVVKGDRKDGFIDLLWKGNLLVEHKSAGKDLNKAFTQAKDYFPGLKDHELPKYICVCNFHKFRLLDLDENTEINFELKELVSNVHHFGFPAGYQKRVFKDQAPINIEAAYRMGLLHDELKSFGYSVHPLEIYLVRLLFCLFAEDTSIFEKDWFTYFIENKTKVDGSDLGAQLAFLFQVLNTPKESRSTILDEDFNIFPYINGKLFDEMLPFASFNSKMRNLILDCSSLDWSLISPSIFGSLFQSTMNPVERRNLGAHYTSEKNIMKVIKPLFLDDLWDEFNLVRENKSKLKEFHRKLSSLRFLDPACGCGNFLVISYRELRLLELEILKILREGEQLALNIDNLVLISLEQFYGIEIEEWPCRIAEVAMWLIDHQMNMKLSEELGQYFVRLPINKSANITNANALRIDWNSLLDPVRTIDIHAKKANIIQVKEPEVVYGEVNVYANDYEILDKPHSREKSDLFFSYIYGNPPFVGKQFQNLQQKEDMKAVLSDNKYYKMLDYVSAWYVKSSELTINRDIKVCFVSTNSITQGEQVGLLWNYLFKKYKIKIQFAHRTFRWNNEAKGVAAVHVVIIGFGRNEIIKKKLYYYENIKDNPQVIIVNNINPYLIEGIDFAIESRTKPICNVPELIFGNMANDGGNLILQNEDEYLKYCLKEPKGKIYIKKFVGSDELINGYNRYCFWLSEIKPELLQHLPLLKDRLVKVRNYRKESSREATRKLSNFPSLFGEIRQKDNPILVIPRVSSENRNYIPLVYFNYDTIINDRCTFINNATLYHFGVLTSEIHMTWVKYTCGRLKSDFNYSNKIVYNNYPWPNEPSDKQVEKVKELAQNVLDTRLYYPESSLADLYNPITMPPDLMKAHQALDRVVDLCYRSEPFKSDSERLEFLFDLYQFYTSNLFLPEKKKRGKRNE